MLCNNCKQEIDRFCEDCGEKLPPRNLRFCGSIKSKTGCAYKRRLAKQIQYTKNHQVGYRLVSAMPKPKLTLDQFTAMGQMPNPSSTTGRAKKYDYWFTT